MAPIAHHHDRMCPSIRVNLCLTNFVTTMAVLKLKLPLGAASRKVAARVNEISPYLKVAALFEEPNLALVTVKYAHSVYNILCNHSSLLIGLATFRIRPCVVLFGACMLSRRSWLIVSYFNRHPHKHPSSSYRPAIVQPSSHLRTLLACLVRCRAHATMSFV